MNDPHKLVPLVQMPKVTTRADQAAAVAKAAAARIAASSVPQQPPPQHFNQAPAAPVVAPKAPAVPTDVTTMQPLPVHEAPAVTNAELLAELQSVHAKLTAHVAASNTFFTMLHAEIAALKSGK